MISVVEKQKDVVEKVSERKMVLDYFIEKLHTMVEKRLNRTSPMSYIVFDLPGMI